MSQMKVSHPDVGELMLKVLSFNTPLQGQIRSSQTKAALHHYPVKASQQKLTMEVVFSSTAEYMAFQTYVRKSHQHANSGTNTPELNLWWPERGIENWSGVVLSIKGGDERFNSAPRAQIEFLLVDSLLSQKTFSASTAESFEKFFDTDIGTIEGILGKEGAAAFRPPSQAAINAGKTPDFIDTLLGNLRR